MKTKFIGGILLLSAVLLATSCERGVDEESFVSGVTNAQLESPKIDDSSFSTLTNSDGTESIKVTWPVIEGAGGYLFNVLCTSNPEDESVSSENPLVIVQDSIIDGCSVTFAKIEDAVYNISLKTLGNEKLNNKDAAEATTFAYSALVPATTIPAGSDIAEFIKANLQDSDKEQGFALEAGAAYTLNDTVDFGLNLVTLRSTATDGVRPTVTVGAEGMLMTQAGLKVKFINFDCTACTQAGLITLSNEPSESILNKNLGYSGGSLKNCYIIEKPIIVQDCNVKNLQGGILYGNKTDWGLKDFRIVNCIMQLANDSKTFIDLSETAGNTSLIKSLSIEKNTFYNIKDNSSKYFIRYANSSNAQPKKVFGDNQNSATFSLRNNTFSKMMSGKEFGNNMPNTNTLITILENNIFYDTWRINKALPTQGERTYTGNIIWGVTKSVDGSDLSRTDSNGNPIAKEEDSGFGVILQELDLTQEKGGVDFTPKGSKVGDPRWL